eukprot:CAMPEP_0167813046 /NCGR_PEP_ID=MMETSP0112_2-20121227/1616_1 /TAXON_ID=91324 /ORGANISM="Lotharella globosa, Strain CCCM811" /LENGTH=63 /DNA_ID=CAMNT_0007712045 /DNA_START=267 /DNA_END=454 /DNA_ORIENTATION=+
MPMVASTSILLQDLIDEGLGGPRLASRRINAQWLRAYLRIHTEYAGALISPCDDDVIDDANGS